MRKRIIECVLDCLFMAVFLVLAMMVTVAYGL